VLFAVQRGPIPALYGTPWILLLALIADQMPFASRVGMSAMAQLGPDVEDAARVMGAGLLRRLRSIVLPILNGALATAILLSFISGIKGVSLFILLAVVVVILLSIGSNAGGEAGHLGGAIVGFLLMRYPRLLGADEEVNIIRPAAFRRRSEAKLRPRSEAHLDEPSEVDRILEKISREGTHSLTQAERDVLIKASERQQR
jgi:hypothetical protein